MRTVVAVLTGLMLLGLTGCAQPTSGTPAPAATPAATAPSTVAAQPSVSVVTPPPTTVYQAPPATVTVPAQPLTPCQQLHADGYSYDIALAAWSEAGFPANWDADRDGWPCEQSYGDQN